MSVYITREMLNHAAYENRHDENVSVIGQLARSFARRRQRRRAIADLEAMDDAMLRDIGIDRSEIRRAVYGFSDRDLGLTRPARMPRTGGRGDDTQAAGEGVVSAYR